MTTLTAALDKAAPIYNLGMVIIVVYLFIKLFRQKKVNKKVFMLPWYYLFSIICVFILEEIITVLRQAGLVSIPIHINGFFELVIVSLAIYVLLMQRDHVAKHH